MLNRFWDFQKLLVNLADFDGERKSGLLKSFFTGMSAFFLSAILGYGPVTFLPLMVGLLMIRHIVHAESELLDTLPVAKIYTIVNMYLFMILAILFGHFIFMIIFPILDIPNLKVIVSLIYGWKVALLLFLTCIVIMSIFIPIFFIKKKIIRWPLCFISYLGILIYLVSYKQRTFPILLETRYGYIDYMKILVDMNNLNNILFYLLALAVIGLPVSIGISYRLYRGKRC
ncbi:hypothetical protein [Clostridium grantii]|uniref:ABC-2 family transporter protein n=1 Tax=Clostridium grantii DSM 8605 TaxID=1121316 RepID=A0A1M5UTT0_9CLOT|nr:hypothetical protein [Clostridium grantii]SHH66344.1 hypothetical protein SAMN02745207_01893 [Clostridium grantii DSM 8605]